jgi:5-hydroxyisourate hydrolase
VARLSTHVLDVSRGAPAAGVRIELHRLGDGARQLAAAAVTNDDGRTAAPLLSSDRIEPGVYELTFHAGDYFRSRGVSLPSVPFLDIVVIRVGLDDPAGHYHVPLLLSPFGYTTYRGS